MTSTADRGGIPVGYGTALSDALYYNETRTHLGLAKDAPRRRALSNDAEGLSQRRFCADCIIAMPGYDFQEGRGSK